ncbi:MAG: hypothetical protein IJS00_05590 [Paludibacteraceae bacterium]|nr:hypothetical protein [Paludibacteraceae bacterium]
MATFFARGQKAHKNPASLGGWQVIFDVQEPIKGESIYKVLKEQAELNDGEFYIELITKLN